MPKSMGGSNLVSVKYWPSHPRYHFIAVWRQANKRQLRYFKRERDAKDFASQKYIELLNEGRRHGEITDAERRAVHVAREAEINIAEAVERFIEERGALARSIPIEDAVDEFLEIRKSESKSGAHLKDLRLRLKAFVLTRPAKQLVEAVTTSDVDTWLTGLPVAAQTRTNYRTVLNNFFKFAVSRGYAPTNPVSAAVKFRVLAKAPGILTPAQLRALLNACVNEIRAAVAIGAFAGLRKAEIERLNWQHVKVDRKFIEVVAANSKTAQRRLVTISENLKAWLAPLARAEGPVCPPFNLYRHLFAAALKNAKIASWPHNALRHSYASYHLAEVQDAGKTALQLGHTEPRMLFAHYRELVTEEEAAEYWNISP
jgi:integrase